MIPTGAEHINRQARVLSDITARNDGRTQYRAGEIVRVMDVRPPTSYGPASKSLGYQRVTVSDPRDGDRRAAATHANNLELLAEGGPVTRAGARPTFVVLDETHVWKPTGDARADRVKARDLMHAHEKVAEAYKALMYAFDHLQEVEHR